MRTRDVFNARAIAMVHESVASNQLPYLGTGLFPPRKKMGLDLRWIKTAKGLPVSLSPSAFDTKSTIRSREGFEIAETQMAFFKESMLLREQDEQDIMRVQESTDPYAREVLERIYDDAETLVAGADVVPERMRMQLLSNPNGNPSISIAANGATYSYNYDPDNSYRTNNFKVLSGTSKWSDHKNSDPIKDIMDVMDTVEESTGVKPTRILMSKATMGHLKANENIRAYILSIAGANVVMNDNRVKEVFRIELGVDIIIYNKQFIDDNGVAQKFFPDGIVTILPDGPLGSTWYGCTPEERTGVLNPAADVAIVNTGVAISVTISEDPVQTKTTVSEIVLPSFERMNQTFTLVAY